ncbi:MAG TPA: TonB family protein [Bryobacteraceae bacterium]|nr:TonB family protein [Bryobacteraceae bacterium]
MSILFAGVALKSVVVLSLAWLARWLLRKRSAALLHLVWTAAFVVLLVLPLLSVSLPALELPRTARLLTPEFIFQTTASASARSISTSALRPNPLTGGILPGSHLDWTAIILLLYLAGVALSAAQMCFGLLAIRRMRRKAHLMAFAAFPSLKRSIGIRRRVDILAIADGCMPMSFSLRRAAIFLPAEAQTWDESRLRIVLLHELAHIQRRDTALHLFARAVLSLYWWNPLAWTAWREFLKQRERAADDLVLNAGAPAPEYASHLLEIARSFQPAGLIEPAAVAMARLSQLEGRLISVLDTRRNRGTLRLANVLAAALLSVAIAAPLAALHARNSTARESSQPSASAAVQLIHLGEQQSERFKFAEAATSYNKALSLFGNTPDAAIAYMHLGFIALIQNQNESALNDFQSAQKANPAKSAQALLWMAIAQQRQNNLQEAAALYQGALAAEDPNSAEAATTLELYAQLLKQQGNDAEASATAQRARTIRTALAAQAPAANSGSFATVYQIKDTGTPPHLISKTEPQYTEEARAAKYTGTTVLSVVIGTDGLAHDVRVVRGLGFGLDQRAIDAVSHWKFAPGIIDSQPVPVAAMIEVNWRLL